MMGSLDVLFGEYLVQIERQLRDLLKPPCEELVPFYGMMHYHLGWVDKEFNPIKADAGKRLRPLLCLLTCQAAGGDFRKALPAAAALELLHNFSQIHDDIEDRDEERRHRPTLWRLWGVPQAINVGDGMMSLVYLSLSKLWERGIFGEKVQDVTEVFLQMYRQLCEGQYLDISFEGRPDVTVEEYLAMIERKTAALISSSAQIGAMLATDDPRTVESCRIFGRNLGLAFQITDDILGIWGDPEVTGKPVGGDILRKKKSLPIVHALGKESTLRQIYSQDRITPEDMKGVLKILAGLAAREYARDLAQGYYQSALEALERASLKGEAQEKLKWLAAFLVEREY